MSAKQKLEVLRSVETSSLSVKEALKWLEVSSSMYHRWIEERTNQGRYCQGRTPLETFNDGLHLYNQ